MTRSPFKTVTSALASRYAAVAATLLFVAGVAASTLAASPGALRVAYYVVTGQ